MGYAVYHGEKGKSGGTSLGQHIDRTKGKEHMFKHADPARLELNVDMTDPKYLGLVLSECVSERIKEGYTATATLRKDAIKYLTHVLTASHEDMLKIADNPKLFQEWIQENKDFVDAEFGKENVVRFVLHMDEKTPHIHAVTVPLTPDGRLSGKEIFGNNKTLSERQDRYGIRMKKFGLSRGIKMTGIKHEDIKKYHARVGIVENEVKTQKEKVSEIFEAVKIKIWNIEDSKNELEAQISILVENAIGGAGKELIEENKALKEQFIGYKAAASYADIAILGKQVKIDVPILDYFATLVQKGILRPEHQIGNEIYFANPHQKTGSIAVNPTKNIFFDHATGRGGSVIDAAMRFEKEPNFSKIVAFLAQNSENINASVVGFKEQIKICEFDENEGKTVVTGVFPIKHPALIEYLKERALTPADIPHAREIHYIRPNGKPYFGIALPDKKGNYAIRNKKFKGNIGSVKAVMYNSKNFGKIAGTLNKVKVFEGMFDFYSYQKLKPKEVFQAIILNGVSNFQKVADHLNDEIEKGTIKAVNITFLLDNDFAGKYTTLEFMKALPGSQDESAFYSLPGIKDLNELLIQKTEIQSVKNDDDFEEKVTPKMRR